ncbi:conserved unknown protein [Ectocarpus siliculosus]|uniref:Bulb-type lectin domain-containing protein n=1 Tax=Ectocarpus siliculosus TaxID=2880 RepID=D7FI44_ECTSI|nr:conserved unknown protein [Ectocarpus siliculosus]|eukprot:CBJ28670.1 conserved unknown protein [Ectocarpus siliculosus]
MPLPHQAAGPRKDSVQASSLELYGALVARGVNPDRRPWAKKLLAQFSTLTELRWLSWRRLMNILDMGVTLGLENPAADHHEHEEDDDHSADEKSKNGKTPATAAEAAAAAAGMTAVLPPVVRKPPALSRGEVAVLEALYAVGSDAPPIRKQALDFGLGLDAAGQLESEGILTSSKLTESNITSFQTKLKVPGKSEAEVKSALMAMVSNKKGVPADQEEDDDPLCGSFDTNEELVAAAGGGMALYGVNFFPNENDVTLKPYAPILKKPTFVEMAGASASFEASVLHSTEQSMASNFTKTTENGGISIAQSSSTSWGVSASVSSFGGAASASVSADSSGTEEGTGEAKGSNAFSANNKTTTTSATTVETITCPMKSFRIPVSTMTMTEEALDHALEVDTLLKAGQFLDTFGSHVSNGRHLLGGIFFRTMTMTTESEVDTSTLLAAASTQMQQSRTESSDSTASAGAGTVGVSVAASATMNSASSSGVVKFHATAGHSESESEDSRAMFHSFVRSMGPNVATPELFAEALFTDTSSWTVIDRGPFEALLPVTAVLENMLVNFDPASPSKTKLEVPVSLRNMIGRSFATEDAQDLIRAAVINLFEILESEVESNLEEAAEAISNAVLATAKEMESKPPGQADFFPTLQSKIAETPEITGKYDFKTNTTEYQTAARSAKKLSSTDWVGFDLIWKKRLGNIALKEALETHIKFEEATLRLGEVITTDEPLTSVDGNYRLEISGKALRVVKTSTGAVAATLFEAEGTLGSSASAHMEENGSFVLDLTMITGFDRTETRMVLWVAPNTESGSGGYARMQNNGKFVVFNRKGKALWSAAS